MEPVAIVGLGCRFPGAPDLDSFWSLLRDGVDAISEVPADRWDVDALYEPEPAAPGKMNTRWGGFVEGIDQFDARFFGISPREAADMDPQQRLLLEVAWESLEHAGQTRERLSGSLTGVFVGIAGVDYSQRQLLGMNHLERISAYTGTGNAHSVAANRLSYALDLRGPSLAVDTACSASLVAVHLACESICRGESSMALAGGVNVILAPEVSIAFAQAHMLAPDGRCKTFDARADGYVRGEGCGIVVLKSLAKARQDGDRILALVRGSAVNQDGRSNGLTAPNGPAQQAVIRAALVRSGVTPAQISYVETHGTGTPIGDPIELHALAAVLAEGRNPDQKCPIGSVKTNIGHLETASGIAGLIKVVLALQHEEIPPHLHLESISPHIDLEKMPLVVPKRCCPWPAGAQPRFAGVSSYGFGGTNAHVVLEEAPAAPERPVSHGMERPLHLLPLTAQSEGALKELALRFARRLTAQPDLYLADVCFTAATRRSQFSCRLAAIGDSSEALRAQLEAFGAGKTGGSVKSGQTRHQNRRKIAFLFTGQGAQYSGMGWQLYQTQPTFRRTLDRCAEILRLHLEHPLLSLLDPASGHAAVLNQTGYTQPTLFALEYALAEMWRSWGIEPDVVMGHSVGEYAAACVAGACSLEEGLTLIAERARLMQALPRDGMMAAVFAGEAPVAACIEGYQEQVSIAALNGPQNTVISGARVSLEAVMGRLQSQGCVVKRLAVSHAFHSPLMEPMLEPFERAASQVRFSAPRIRLVGNVTGQALAPGEVPTADYWRRHARQPVQFATGMETVAELGCELLIELGPNPTLLELGRRCLPAGTHIWLPSLRRGQDDWHTLLDSLATLFVHGVPVDWSGFDYDYPRRPVDLPTYPFERERYWALPTWDESQTSTSPPAGGARQRPLLGKRLSSAQPGFECALNLHSYPYLSDHRIQGTLLFPASGYVEMALAAAAEAFGPLSSAVSELELHAALLLPEEETRIVQVLVTPDETGPAALHIYSRAAGKETRPEAWTLHATGTLHYGPWVTGEPDPNRTTPDALKERLPDEMSGNDYYQRLHRRGFHYGPCFRAIQWLWRRDGEALGELRLPQALAEDLEAYQLHPVLLDACFQVLGAAVAQQVSRTVHGSVFLPVGFERVRVHAPIGDHLWSHACFRPGTDGSGNVLEGDIDLLDEAGQVLAEVRGFRVQSLEWDTQRAGADTIEDWLYELQWRVTDGSGEGETAKQPAPATRGSWLIFADGGGIGERLAVLLANRGERPVLITPGEVSRSGPPSAALEQFQLQPAAPEDVMALLRDALSGDRPPCRGVLHLSSLDSVVSRQTTVGQLMEAQLGVCASVLHLVQGLAGSDSAGSARLWLFTRGAQAAGEALREVSLAQSPLWGLGRVIAHEHPDQRTTLVDLDPAAPPDETALLLDELLIGSAENQIAFRDGARYVARLVHCPRAALSALAEESSSEPRLLPVPADPSYRLEIATPGVLDSLVLQPSLRRAPGPGQLEIRISAAGLNFRDVMKALGIYPTGYADATWLGDECVGEVAAVGEGVTNFRVGDEVIAVAPACFGAFATTSALFAVPKPEQMSATQAVTIPIAFLTAYYALCHLGHLRAGERVLIHAAAGGVGQAAVQIAQHSGAEIFATAGSPEKRAFLHSLGVEHVFDSRSLAFAEEIRERTEGSGVDLVLNSLAGQAIAKSLALLGPYGRFLEIGKRDIFQNSKIGLRPFQNNLAFFAIDLDRLFRERPAIAGSLLREVMRQFAAGDLRPLPLREFPLEQAVRAFRYMAQAQNIGKIVFSMPERRATELTASEQRNLLRPDATYLITGGLGALGLLVARWMVQRGARHLVLIGRHEPSTAAQEALTAMQALGAQVRVARADVGSEQQLAKVLAQIAGTMPPLRGVIHAAGVLDDGLLLQLTRDRLRAVMEPKIRGAWNLHVQTANEALDFFVLFSSVASLLGPPGQGNYAAANAFLDALAQHRRALGLPGLSVNWGPWADVGMAARTAASGQPTFRGVENLPAESALGILERLLSQSATQMGVLRANWENWLELYPAASQEPLLFDLIAPNGRGATVRQSGEAREALLASPPEERQLLLETYIQREVARVLGLESGQLDLLQPLSTAGMDSLMAVELRSRVEANLGVTLPMVTLDQELTITHLATQLLAAISAEAVPS